MKIWHTKVFLLYDQILPLVEGRYATGEEAFDVGESYNDNIDGAVEDNFNADLLPNLNWPASDDNASGVAGDNNVSGGEYR